jgi:hypothetical protein
MQYGFTKYCIKGLLGTFSDKYLFAATIRYALHPTDTGKVSILLVVSSDGRMTNLCCEGMQTLILRFSWLRGSKLYRIVLKLLATAVLRMD